MNPAESIIAMCNFCKDSDIRQLNFHDTLTDTKDIWKPMCLPGWFCCSAISCRNQLEEAIVKFEQQRMTESEELLFGARGTSKLLELIETTEQPGPPETAGQPRPPETTGQPGPPETAGQPRPPETTGQPGPTEITRHPGPKEITRQPGPKEIIETTGQSKPNGQSAAVLNRVCAFRSGTFGGKARYLSVIAKHNVKLPFPDAGPFLIEYKVNLENRAVVLGKEWFNY